MNKEKLKLDVFDNYNSFRESVLNDILENDDKQHFIEFSNETHKQLVTTTYSFDIPNLIKDFNESLKEN